MKKNKTIQIALIILVIAIWGGVVYRFTSFDAAQQTQASANVINLKKKNYSIPPFELALNYTDPFRINSKPKHTSSNTNMPRVHKTPRSKPIQLPSSIVLSQKKAPTQLPYKIDFLGFVKGKATPTALLKIKGKRQTVTAGYLNDSLHVLKIDKNGALIQFHGVEFRVD